LHFELDLGFGELGFVICLGFRYWNLEFRKSGFAAWIGPIGPIGPIGRIGKIRI